MFGGVLLQKVHPKWLLVIIVISSLILSASVRSSAQTQLKSLILPMAEPPGPSTWLFGQAYGNTTGAYNFGTQWYSAGQGLHFGLDFPMPCGTQLVAAADGTVAHVDNLGFGSGPHNLLVRHDALGIATLYGHLLERPALVEGQNLSKGQFVGLSGDPDVTCDSRPHLHFEVRNLSYRTTYNPIDYIDAHWHSLALVGGYGYPLFQQDLQNARRWMSLESQPEVSFGGVRLNAYTFVWPLPNNLRAPDNPILHRPFTPLAQDTQWQLRLIGYDRCCWRRWWDAIDPNKLYVIDGGSNELAGIFEWNVASGGPSQLIGSAPPALTSPDGSHEIYAGNGGITIRRKADGTTWAVNTEGTVPAISPDNAHLLWIKRSGLSTPGATPPPTRIYVSDVDGANTREIFSQRGAGASWLDATRVLLSTREDQITTFSILNITDNSLFTLGAWESIRGVSVAPGGRWLTYFQTWQADDTLNGVYIIETQAGAVAQKLDWFGSWRWRDAESLYYIPYNPSTSIHQLMYYQVTTGENRVLTTPDTLPFTVMNGDWEVSADGTKVVFQNAVDNNMWLLEAIGGGGS